MNILLAVTSDAPNMSTPHTHNGGATGGFSDLLQAKRAEETQREYERVCQPDEDKDDEMTAWASAIVTAVREQPFFEAMKDLCDASTTATVEGPAIGPLFGTPLERAAAQPEGEAPVTIALSSRPVRDAHELDHVIRGHVHLRRAELVIGEGEDKVRVSLVSDGKAMRVTITAPTSQAMNCLLSQSEPLRAALASHGIEIRELVVRTAPQAHPIFLYDESMKQGDDFPMGSGASTPNRENEVEKRRARVRAIR